MLLRLSEKLRLAFGVTSGWTEVMGIPMAVQLVWRIGAYGFLVLVACGRDAAVRQHETKRFTN